MNECCRITWAQPIGFQRFVPNYLRGIGARDLIVVLQEKSEVGGPILPRRAFVAAGLSAVTAGSFVALAMFGGLSRIESGIFLFTRGLSFVAGQEAQLRGLLSDALSDERIHVTIIGHTGDAGDASANQTLSEKRADLVRAMAEELGIASDRITARGIGGAALLSQTDGESDRAYQQRLARVEVSLQMRR